MFGFFKKDDTITIKSPLTGNVLQLTSISDPVFSSEMMGKGIAIEPSVGVLYSPVHGVVAHVFPTKHALGLVSDDGIEILLHIGIDTVQLGGEGFECHVRENDKVSAGDRLISFDMESIKGRGKSVITPMVITNSDIVDIVDFVYGTVDKDSVVMTVKLNRGVEL